MAIKHINILKKIDIYIRYNILLLIIKYHNIHGKL